MSDTMSTKTKKKTTSKKNEVPTEDEVIPMDIVDDEAPEVKIEDLPGVGPATAEKLREAGFDELLALAVMSPADLAEQAELGEAVAGKIINAAKKMATLVDSFPVLPFSTDDEKFRSSHPRFNPLTISSEAVLKHKLLSKFTEHLVLEKPR